VIADGKTTLCHPKVRLTKRVLHRALLMHHIPALMSRTRRLFSSLQFGFLNQLLAMLVGLWLTRYALHLVGREQYGLWLFGLQLLAYLALLDLGVAALLPREAAFAAGSPASVDWKTPVRRVVAEAWQLSLWQTPLVATAAAILWVAIPHSWAPLRPVLAFALAVFIAVFPFRIYQALLIGLQDLAFTGAMQTASWALGTGTTIALLAAGQGLPSLVAGWAVSQLVTPLACWSRVRARFAEALPPRHEWVHWLGARDYLRRSVWLSAGQIANNVQVGADVLIIGALLGPAAVVAYTCTGKLIAVLSNVPLALAQTAGPALSDLRVRESRQRLRTATMALTQAVLIASGALTCVILVVTEGFVSRWVGASLFGGVTLTTWLLVSMVVRHWGTTLVYAVYSFGHERRLAMIAVGQAASSIGLMLALVHGLGPVGAPVGSVGASVLVTFPFALMGLRQDLDVGILQLLRPLAPWMARFAFAGVAAYVSARVWSTTSPLALVGAAGTMLILYGALMFPILFRPPLRDYMTTAVASVSPGLLRFIPRLTPR
jgi:O-antigen/teichoic acid export membrane protein